MKFKSLYKRERKAKKFNQDIKIKQMGKEMRVQDIINEARADTEIYPTLEKYGTIEKMKINPNKLYTEFGAMKSLKDIMDQQIEAKKLWNTLPYDMRMRFNNNIGTFLKEGEKFLQNEIEKARPKEVTPQQTEQTQTTTTKE